MAQAVIVTEEELAETLRAVVREEVQALRSVGAEKGWLDPKSAAAYLDMSPDAIAGAVKRGQLVVHRTAPGRRRFKREELDDFATAKDIG